jgi:GT2 family glycosyltransferase
MISVLIVNWNTRDLLDACLKSIPGNSGGHDVEVIVVDNASHDGSADMVRERHPHVKLIEPGSNTGYARGNNLAFAASSGGYVLTLNPDTELESETLEESLKAMDRHPEAVALGACQIGTDGLIQRSVRGFPSLRGIIGELTGLAKAYPKSAWGAYQLPAFDYSVEQPAPQPMGTFLFFRRSALDQLQSPPYDEQFPIFFNEVDLLYRLSKQGGQAWYVPSVRILHHGGEGTRQVRKAMIWESHRSLMRFFEKHHPSPLLPLLKLLVYAGACLRARGVYAGFRP